MLKAVYFFNTCIGITSEIKVEMLPVAYLTAKRLKHQVKDEKRREKILPVQQDYTGNTVKDLAAMALVPPVNVSHFLLLQDFTV